MVQEIPDPDQPQLIVSIIFLTPKNIVSKLSEI
jgi:hypothetical protein